MQAYLIAINPPAGTPRVWLVDFRKVAVSAGQEAVIEWSLPLQKMSLIDESGYPALLPGEYELIIGGCSPGLGAEDLGAPTPVRQQLRI
ncbi:MAG: fibronectin type III-like domain-contianing protein [Anaerolineales bacterium]|nr:fibronectin type III-like domain-contianing protein [Anaerolineales bacterium]